MTVQRRRNDGMNFEDQIFSRLSAIVKCGYFPFLWEHCISHRKISYFSPLRNGMINFENVIEVYSGIKIPGLKNKPILAVVFECKDTKRPVEVGEVEEFFSKINHPIGIRIKGVMVSTSGFQKGALNFADKCGIGLIRMLPDGQVHYNLFCIVDCEENIQNIEEVEVINQRNKVELLRALTEPGYISGGVSEFFFYHGEHSSIRSFLSAIGLPKRRLR